ncbi:RING_CH-C4HC3_MARCH2_like domain-containing protein [Anabas testudineus]|uniref:RING_CH-C4HC3_MARCH2_like domain-containing protein n=1 Tax=Anabas testudineus TaxID=64144 RepID=UPI000E461A04|nr:RING_CH-C4HC3_MARCH2_like domain-containing protein [Anabas testudineus]
MAPHILDMTTKEPLGPWVLSPLGETKLMPEHRQEVTLYDTDTLCEECAPITDSEELFCRICHEGRASGELLSPCECSGSLAMVHRACLERWLTASKSNHCELCHYQFTLERLPKPLTEWLCSPSMQQQRRTLCGDALCFLFITPLASLSGWLCVQGAVDLYYTNGMEALGLLVLTLALFTIYMFWTMVSVRYHMHLFKTWQETDQKVQLQIPLPSHTTNNQQIPSINTPCKATDKETMV